MSCHLRIGFVLVVLSAVLANYARGQSEETISCHKDLSVRPVVLDDGWALMDSSGKILVSERYSSSDEFSDGLFLFGTSDGWEYIDPTGKKVLTLRNKFIAWGFSEGLAAASDKSGKYGFIDKTGRAVIPKNFEMPRMFNEGLAAVEVDGSWHYIDRTGQIVISPKYEGQVVLFAGDFHSDRARIVIGASKNGDSRWGFIDRTGKWAIAPTFQGADDFYGELAAVQIGKKWGFIDSSGQVRIPATFVSVGSAPFNPGSAAVGIEDAAGVKHGFIDASGAWVVQPDFSDARHFCDGLAPVKVKDRWGYIDATGVFVVQPQFADAQAFDGGVASVVVIDKQGRMHSAYIDTKGLVLWQSSGEVTFIRVD